jgi:hypothetical protein
MTTEKEVRAKCGPVPTMIWVVYWGMFIAHSASVAAGYPELRGSPRTNMAVQLPVPYQMHRSAPPQNYRITRVTSLVDYVRAGNGCDALSSPIPATRWLSYILTTIGFLRYVFHAAYNIIPVIRIINIKYQEDSTGLAYAL